MRQFGLYFLYTDFLEVNKFGLVNIEQKFTSVAASRISTCRWLFENLKHRIYYKIMPESIIFKQ